MVRYFHRPLVHIPERWVNIMLLLLAPLVTTVNGIAIDLYAPSLPAISSYFGVSSAAAKSSISIGLVGFGISVLFFGALSDRFGRRKLILAGLMLFVASSYLAEHAASFNVFMIARFIQGAGVACAAMLVRAALIDHFTGRQLYIAMLYTTMAWGAGPVIAPFVGGYLQNHYGWQSNFQAYTLYGLVNLVVVLLFLQETLHPSQRVAISALKRYWSIIKVRQFQVFVLFCAFCFIQFISFNLFAPFLVEQKMGLSAEVFGHCALWVGVGYLAGTILNRYVLKYMSVRYAFFVGIGISSIGTLALSVLAIMLPNSLYALVAPIVVVTLGVGIAFPNAITQCLSVFKENAGSAASLHGGTVMMLGFLITMGLSQIQIVSPLQIASILATVIAMNIFLMLVAIHQKVV